MASLISHERYSHFPRGEHGAIGAAAHAIDCEFLVTQAVYVYMLWLKMIIK